MFIDNNCRLNLDYLHVGVILILIEHFSLILLQSFLGVFVFRMYRAQSAVKLLFAIFQFGVIDAIILCVEGWQLLIFYSFLKIARNRSSCSCPGICRLRPRFSGGSNGPHLFIWLGVSVLEVGIGGCPCINFLKVFLLVFGEGYSGEFAEHFEQFLYKVLS